MTVQIIANQHRQVAVDIVSPAPQASTNTVALLVGSELDMRIWRSLSYTVKIATQTVKWWVYAGNLSDYSDEVIVNGPTSTVAAAVGSYSIAQAPFGYYRVKIQSDVVDVHGTATLTGVAKG